MHVYVCVCALDSGSTRNPYPFPIPVNIPLPGPRPIPIPILIPLQPTKGQVGPGVKPWNLVCYTMILWFNLDLFRLLFLLYLYQPHLVLDLEDTFTI